ncbi:hypothetical protein SmJEL517_g04705 [Synchytrium microbalum]|uniref:Nucleotide-diphospho-sugar transferase domain-containing protein n=1 Tax=Synchytrium microbalum TaxID=1806994 RepID=A0A507C2E7_9FUNG|nr:uncharacterized protein SmJEL517_g04705 [Synchytrium microbalum]TPX32126.1 hypothetical protein SmJEL517_g04705 [Synchytrium microbalum]
MKTTEAPGDIPTHHKNHLISKIVLLLLPVLVAITSVNGIILYLTLNKTTVDPMPVPVTYYVCRPNQTVDSRIQQYGDSNPSNVTIVSLYFVGDNDEQAQLRKWTWHSREAYASRWGHRVVDATTYPLIHTFPGVDPKYLKILAMILTMEDRSVNRPQWVMWMDSDAFFLNHSKPLEEHLDARYDLILSSAGKPPRDLYAINNGIFFVRNTRWSRNFFREQWNFVLENQQTGLCPRDEYGKLLDDNNPNTYYNGYFKLCGTNVPWKDQALMMLTLANPSSSLVWREKRSELSGTTKTTLHCHVKYTALRDFNSVPPWYKPGDLVVHLPGLTAKQRITIISEFARISDFNTGVVRHNETRMTILKPSFAKWPHPGTPTVSEPADATDEYPGKGGWYYNEACQAS